MSFAAVFDPSAMIAYARGSEAVGELLLMFSEEDRSAALPAVALAEAFRACTEDHHPALWLLAHHGDAALVPLDLTDAEPVGTAARVTTLGVAHAAVVATRAGVCLVTAAAKSLAGLVDDDMIIEV